MIQHNDSDTSCMRALTPAERTLASEAEHTPPSTSHSWQTYLHLLHPLSLSTAPSLCSPASASSPFSLSSCPSDPPYAFCCPPFTLPPLYLHSQAPLFDPFMLSPPRPPGLCFFLLLAPSSVLVPHHPCCNCLAQPGFVGCFSERLSELTTHEPDLHSVSGAQP